MKKICIYNSGGGLGDSIQLFSLILSLKNHFKETQFYYLGAHENHYLNKLKEYNLKVKTLDLSLKYFGFRWWHFFKAKKQYLKLYIDEFDMIIDLQTKLRNTLILKRIPAKNFYSATYKFIFCTFKAKYSSTENICDMTLLNIEKFLNIKIKKISYDLKNISHNILQEAQRLLPKSNYIGFSLTQGNKYRKKGWPLENFIELAKKTLTLNKVPVFFLNSLDNNIISKIKEEVPDALFPELNSKLDCPALVTALSSRLEKAISIDNGIMHMIGLTKIPMVILFGPTNSQKFAPDKQNITILDSKKLYKTNDISKIKIDDVLKYLN